MNHRGLISPIRGRSHASIDRVKQLHRMIRPLGEPTRRTLEHGRREPVHSEYGVPLARPPSAIQTGILRHQPKPSHGPDERRIADIATSRMSARQAGGCYDNP
jgi:hypothetical protein